MWVALERWVKYFFNIEVKLLPETIIFNMIGGKEKHMLNVMTLIMKQFIYAKKCKINKPKFQDFVSKVTQWYNIEKSRCKYEWHILQVCEEMKDL